MSKGLYYAKKYKHKLIFGAVYKNKTASFDILKTLNKNVNTWNWYQILQYINLDDKDAFQYVKKVLDNNKYSYNIIYDRVFLNKTLTSKLIEKYNLKYKTEKRIYDLIQNMKLDKKFITNNYNFIINTLKHIGVSFGNAIWHNKSLTFDIIESMGLQETEKRKILYLMSGETLEYTKKIMKIKKIDHNNFWEYENVFYHMKIDLDMIKKIHRKEKTYEYMMIRIISPNKYLTSEIIEYFGINKAWDWKAISWNIVLTLDFVEKYKHKLLFNLLRRNKSLTFDIIECLGSNKKWIWHLISRNINFNQEWKPYKLCDKYKDIVFKF